MTSLNNQPLNYLHTRIREKLLPRARRRRLAVPSLESNDGSVVLAIRVGSASALLGADLEERNRPGLGWQAVLDSHVAGAERYDGLKVPHHGRSEEHTSELQSQSNLVCRLLLEKKK